MLHPSYFLSDLQRSLRASCETFAETPNDAPIGKAIAETQPDSTGFAEFVRDVIPTAGLLNCVFMWALLRVFDPQPTVRQINATLL
jgi:hypothetical protein